LLLPKVIAVAVCFGSLAAALYLWTTGDGEAATLGLVSNLLARVTAPALIAAAGLGALLMVEPGMKVMLRQRWLQVKLLALSVGIPGMWVWIARALWRAQPGGAVVDRAAWWNVTAALAVALAASLAVIVLGRHKPRIGQNWAKALAQARLRRGAHTDSV
jgi:uncharacterized membrane protein